MSSRPDSGPAAARYPERRWLTLFILLLAGFMNLIDVTIVNVALPRLQASFGATSSQIEWMVAAYVLAFALGLLPFGRLGDTIGRPRMFLLGVALFTLFSGLCGIAPDMNTLIFARVLQGLAGAMMMPQVLAIVQVIFPPQERGLAFSFFGLSAGLASVAGPLVGGLLIDADLFGLDWRPIFLVNLPIGLLAIAAGWALIPKMPGNPDLKHDPVGVLIAGAAIFLLVFPLIEGRGFGWPLWAFAMIAASFLAMAAFFFYERHRARSGLTQLLPVSLISNGSFLLGSVMTMTFFSGIAGFFLVLAVFLQTGFGFSPLESGLTTIPFPSGVLVASIVSGRLRGRFQRTRIAVGAGALVAGMMILSHVVAGIGDTVDHWDFVLPLALSGFGMGVAISSLFQTVLANVPPADAGAGSGSLQSFQQIGSALGIAITGEIFFSSLRDSFMAGSMPHPAFVAGLGNALLYEIVAFALVAVMILFLKVPPQAMHGRQPEAQRERPPVPVEA
jgi:EmrB/QacA subfamily drug resistance transporter